MVTKVQKWGNSQGLRFSREILEEAHISVGDTVRVTFRQGAIVVMPEFQVRGKYNLESLVSRIPRDCYKSGKEEWGRPMGKEAW